jgi:hypothetical protein
MANSRPPSDEASDAARWWRAYGLAESDQVGELRKLAAAGDDHARRQLASWLSERAAWPDERSSDRARLQEAIEVIRPLADAGDDVAELWLVRWLADSDRLDELRQRADRGSYHAGRLLARCLAGHDLLDELRQRADSGSYHASLELDTRLAEHDRYHELRVRASASGGDHALCELARRLAQRDMHRELRELAVSADPDRRQLILDAARAGSTRSVGGMDVLRVLADLGDKRGRALLARWLAQTGHLDELRERAASGDEYARDWLEEALTHRP